MKFETRQLSQHAKESKGRSGCPPHGWIGGACIYCGKEKRGVGRRPLTKCAQCGGKRVILESAAEGYSCLDCGACDSDE